MSRSLARPGEHDLRDAILFLEGVSVIGLYIYFGVPGSGKTTHAASIVYRNLKKGFPTFSNVEIKGAFLYDPRSDLSVADISYCDVILDEAAIDFNSRRRDLSQAIIGWLKKYRHYHVRDFYVYSQSYEDMDVTIRRLADRYFVIRKSLLPWIAVIRGINVAVGPNENHEMCDQYAWSPGFKILWLPAYWKMFDSWEAAPLMERSWECCSYGDQIDRDPGNRQLKEIWRNIRSSDRRRRREKLLRLWHKLFPEKEEPPDDYIRSLME